MKRTEFKKLVREALDDIPKRYLKALENIEITVEGAPSAAVAKELELGEEDILLGLYQGVPITKRNTSYGNVLPDKITLFQKSIERSCLTPSKIKKAVRDTVVHEIAHYFGIGDKRLRELDL